MKNVAFLLIVLLLLLTILKAFPEVAILLLGLTAAGVLILIVNRHLNRSEAKAADAASCAQPAAKGVWRRRLAKSPGDDPRIAADAAPNAQPETSGVWRRRPVRTEAPLPMPEVVEAKALSEEEQIAAEVAAWRATVERQDAGRKEEQQRNLALSNKAWLEREEQRKRVEEERRGKLDLCGYDEIRAKWARDNAAKKAGGNDTPANKATSSASGSPSDNTYLRQVRDVYEETRAEFERLKTSPQHQRYVCPRPRRLTWALPSSTRLQGRALPC
ncbi:hypothetical protein [Azospirillum soli]|uniref:hypothetical protein n=1 Tax=Azospirillum soli TaxID=1304799 RepID=UPI001AE45F95|nr:hypothetical protein [Azospirillum soli]MBP2315561.1 hypothetical protein [Azospirillum soli]